MNNLTFREIQSIVELARCENLVATKAQAFRPIMADPALGSLNQEIEDDAEHRVRGLEELIRR